jgi:uncharacterized membrane protein YphA (DoxX/SURF4 family)
MSVLALMHRIIRTTAPRATFLIRLMVGGIFLSEGIQKFLYPNDLGAGRFLKIGIPAPELMGPLVGSMECLFGILILLGFLTRLAALPLLATMCVAIISTKAPILVGHGFLGFPLQPLPRYGLLSILHEARTDLCMISGLLFLLIVGAGKFSVDYLLSQRELKQG